MFFQKRYSQLRTDCQNRIAAMHHNSGRAYQYETNRLQNEYPKHSISGEEYPEYKNTAFTLTDSKYVFYDFHAVRIGKDIALSEDDYIVIDKVHFDYCRFQDVKFKYIIFRQCNFSGSTFENAVFEHAVFDGCQFSVPVLEDRSADADSVYYAPAIFKGCTIIGSFRDCNLDHVLCETVCFLAKFERCSMQESVCSKCALQDVNFKDCDLSGFGISQTDILGISVSDEKKTIVNESTYIDYKLTAKKGKAEIATESGWTARSYEELCLNKAKSIDAFSRLFALNNLSDYSGGYYYQSKCLEHKALHKLPKLISYAILALCGYGERPSYTMYTILITALFFGLIYMVTGIAADGVPINYSILHRNDVGFSQAIHDYIKCLFFSITTFSTVGYGNYTPLGTLSMVMSSIHIMLGISLCALWTGCLFRKIVR